MIQPKRKPINWNTELWKLITERQKEKENLKKELTWGLE